MTEVKETHKINCGVESKSKDKIKVFSNHEIKEKNDDMKISVIKKNDSDSDEDGVKSVAVVKYSAVETPAAFTRLRCNTNLNLPPSNWLSNSVETYGLRPSSFFHRPGFSSFNMAHMFPDCVGAVDVVSDAENIKKLLKIPYSQGPVSMMIHRIENTLLIDEFDVHKYLLREGECQWEWFKKFFIENMMQSKKAENNLIHHRDNSRSALQQKVLVSKFLYHSLVVADSVKIDKSQEAVESSCSSTPLPLTYKSDPPLPEPSLEEELPDPASNHKYSRNVIWTFEDIQMLLGTDMPIFGGGTHPCISLRLRDMTKPINVLTGVDYWLDNLMCNVPEVVMCYHLNGIVQKYELIKTEDLPNLENSKFSPKVIRDIAQNILSFLKANATKAGHTYWLFKGKNDDVVKLYDLTSLCTEVMDEKGQTPFTVPVAMLLYRVAKNMKASSDGQRHASTIRMLLNNCVSLLSPEKYSQIVTSAHYMLADLYIPAYINPASPELFSNEESAQEQVQMEKQTVDDSDKKDFAIKSMSLANISEIYLDETEFMSPPPPLGVDLVNRCVDGIRHVLLGLSALKYLRDLEGGKENVPVSEEEPTMAKPFQTIPMPYQSLNGENDTDCKSSKKKSKKKKRYAKTVEEALNFLCKPKAEAFPSCRSSVPNTASSWNRLLKILLYGKMIHIFSTLFEKSFTDLKFGFALLYIKVILKVRNVLRSLEVDLGNDTVVESYFLGRAGDSLFMAVQDSKSIKTFNKEYFSMPDFVIETLNELKKEGVEDNLCDETLPNQLNNLEDLLCGSSRCYQKAIEMETSSVYKKKLLRRFGSIENELGVYYMNKATAKYQEEINANEKGKESFEFKELFLESQRHLEKGINAFDSVKDLANLALLYSNTGRLMRVQAHFMSMSEDGENDLAAQERNFYKKSVSSYQTALQILVDRKFHPDIWDSVHWELSTTLFGMATLLQDYPSSTKSKEEAEREVTETLHKALKYCDVDTPSSRQLVYQFRSAMIHHRLASLYHNSCRTGTGDETKRKKLLQLCKLHYEKSTKQLLQLENSSEYLRVQLERVALAEFQAEGAFTSSGKVKYYENALELLVEATPIIKIISERDMKFYDIESEAKTDEEEYLKNFEKKEEGGSKSESENELNLLGYFEQRLQFILMSLTKLTMSKNENRRGVLATSETFKKLYGSTLRTCFDKRNPVEFAKSILSVLVNIEKNIKSLPNT